MDILDSWARSLRAGNRSALTIDAYMADVGHLRAFLDGIDELDATRRDIDGFLANRTRADGREGQLADATIARRYRTLVQFYGWLELEGEIQANPMAKRKPPIVSEQPPPIIPEDQLTALLDACRGKQSGKTTRHRTKTAGTKSGRFSEFECRRDEALILMLSTTGIRSAELMGLHLDDIELGPETFTVRGKGNRLRIVAMLPQVVEAIDRYLRSRRRHRNAGLPNLWVGEQGPLTTSGLRQVLMRRCADAG
ncbi:MAG: tyrosine-type recombinase/integrase, partial [Acidimicrobiales bacterium]